MHDRERDELNQRFIAGKALDGASLEEIADGFGDPVKEMNYITGQDNRAGRDKLQAAVATKPTKGVNVAQVIWVILGILAIPLIAFWLLAVLLP